ncbi:MAG: OmpA family protein [Treponema sp.]|jgi:outer membrane protein OmpA-like peptidoglycan-associated protein|nr:OmpA family protein [Treponema sp.]
MKKTAFIVTLLLCGLVAANAQNGFFAGVKAGGELGLSRLGGDLKDLAQTRFGTVPDEKLLFSFTAGAYGGYAFTDWFAALAGADFYYAQGLSLDEPEGSGSITYSSLDIPLLARFSLPLHPFTLGLQAGPFLSIPVGTIHTEGGIFIGESKPEGFVFGASGGLFAAFPLGPGRVTGDIRYLHDVTPLKGTIEHSGGGKEFLSRRGMVFMLGYEYAFGGRPSGKHAGAGTAPDTAGRAAVVSEPDVDGPELAVTFSTRQFSPDNDGTDDRLTVTLGARDASPLGGWRIEIREPQPPYLLFAEWIGHGDLPETLVWDGRGASGELVQSASAYPFTLTAADIHGNISVFEDSIEVDLLVIREGENLRIQVPSIVFAPNSGGFEGLDTETVAANDLILWRIAEELNKFESHQVRVEGHANATGQTEAARRQEQVELQRLSEARARTVVEYLVRLGVDRRRLSYIGVGAARPVADMSDHDNWWKNRRVEFLLVK